MERNGTLTQRDLDRILDNSAEVPERFEAVASEWIDRLDAKETDLEISPPLQWLRRPVAPESHSRTNYLNQFRADVESVETLDRADEARLARRIEFARLRLKAQLEREGIDAEPMPEQFGEDFTEVHTESGEAAPASETLRRRVRELHALRTEMVERNLYLVLINVERYAHGNASKVDLIQEGCVALFRAVDGFDWRRGLLFRTYAVHWLNQAFRNYIYNFASTVRVPVYLQKALKHINEAQIRLGDPNASVEAIAEATNLSENLVSSALAAARSSFSIDAGLGDDDGGNRLRDLLAEESEEGPYSTRLEQVSLEEGIHRALDRLSDRERLVVEMRFGVGQAREHTLAEVAEVLGVSVERVRQIQVRALSKLDTPGLRRDLDPFLN